MAKSSDYEVGYGKPPESTRFKTGVSGNPGGRQTGHRGLKTDLENSLNSISTMENKLTGKKVKGRLQQLAVQRMVERAALGDLKAATLVFQMIMQVLGPEDRNKGPRKLSPQDQEILAQVLGLRMSEISDRELPKTGEGSAEAKLTTDETEIDAQGGEEDGDQ